MFLKYPFFFFFFFFFFFLFHFLPHTATRRYLANSVCMTSFSSVGPIVGLAKIPSYSFRYNYTGLVGLTCKLKMLWEAIRTTETTTLYILGENTPFGQFFLI